MWSGVYHQIRKTSWLGSRLGNTLTCCAGSRANSSNEMEAKIFNRTHEIATLQSVLKVKSQFSLISGPVHSGKSTLMSEVLDRINNGKQHPSILRIDLRNHIFRDVQSFSSSMMQSLHSWSSTWFRLPVKGEIMIPDVGGVSLKWAPKSQPEKDLNILYEKLSKALSMLRGYSIPPPVLFIDEGNRLKCLLEDEKGGSVLSDFFAWLVENSKQTNKFHVVMASSDSFFHRMD